jgi:hypothetical protein
MAQGGLDLRNIAFTAVIGFVLDFGAALSSRNRQLPSPIDKQLPAAYTPNFSLHDYQLTGGQLMSDNLFGPPFLELVVISSR